MTDAELTGLIAEPVLRDLRMELLRGCPLICAHCSASAAPRHPLILERSRALTLVSEFAGMGGERLTLTGGEPFEYPGFGEVVRHARREALNIRVFSSGVVWRGEQRFSVHPDQLAQLRPASDTLVVSLYSPDPEHHDRVTRVPGSLDLTLQTIRAARSLGLRTEIHFVPTRLNHHELASLAELAARLGVPRVSVLRFVPQGRGAQGAGELTLHREEYMALRQTVTRLRESVPDLEIALGSAHAFLNLEGCGPCTAALDQLVVGADGRVSPCSAFAGFTLPGDEDNVLHVSLPEVWRRARLLNAVRSAHRTAPGCTGCLAQKALFAGHLDPLGPDPLDLGSHVPSRVA